MKLNKKINLEKVCDLLWAKLIKLKARNRSEISGDYNSLNAHHLAGKSCHRLRYEEENGMSLTENEHLYYAHGNKKEFEFRVKQLRGEDIFDRLNKLKQDTTKLDLLKVKENFEMKIKVLQQYV